MHMLRTSPPDVPTLPTSGFTLVEVLVAVSLLLIALVGPMTYITNSSQATEVANQQVPAVYLAQEGVEMVQKVRDDELLEWFANPNHEAWDEMKNELAPCFGSEGCGLSINGSEVAVTSCAGTDSCRLYYDDSGENRSRYRHNDQYATTPYTRIIRIQEIQSGQEIEVVSQVTWRSGTQIASQSVDVRTSILNIYDTN